MNDTSKIKKHVLTVLLLSSVLNNTKYKVDFNQFFKIYTLYPTNWVSFALSLVEPKRSTTYGWVSMKTSRNSLKSLKRIYFQLIWLKGLSVGTSRSPIMSAIPQSPFQTLPLTFISNYLKLALFLLSRWKRFSNLLSVIVTTLI